MTRDGYFRYKRLADIAFSATILVALAPILAVVAVMVKLTSPGPILYRAHRVGQHGKEFSMLKFRTMVQNADKCGPEVTAGDDPRITKIGKLLRRSKLDEIPQFWNVLVGDMSVVGPRPNVPSLIAGYEGEARDILTVPQGITDFASLWFRMQEGLLEGSGDVMAEYEAKVAPIKIRLGCYYAHHGSLKTDWNLFIATFAAVFLRRDPMWAFPLSARAQVLELVDGTQEESLQAA